jgi:hypothetical protein
VRLLWISAVTIPVITAKTAAPALVTVAHALSCDVGMANATTGKTV